MPHKLQIRNNRNSRDRLRGVKRIWQGGAQDISGHFAPVVSFGPGARGHVFFDTSRIYSEAYRLDLVVIYYRLCGHS